MSCLQTRCDSHNVDFSTLRHPERPYQPMGPGPNPYKWPEKKWVSPVFLMISPRFIHGVIGTPYKKYRVMVTLGPFLLRHPTFVETSTIEVSTSYRAWVQDDGDFQVSGTSGAERMEGGNYPVATENTTDCPQNGGLGFGKWDPLFQGNRV